MNFTFLPETKYIIDYNGEILFLQYINSNIFLDTNSNKKLTIDFELINSVNDLTLEQWAKLSNGELYTVKTDLIEAIISRKELINFHKIFSKDTVLISIYNPGENPINLNYFDTEYYVAFWDSTTNRNNKPVIDKKIAKKIKKFILENKDKKFIINCEAGISRSAGLGFAIECLINCNGCPYTYGQTSSKIRSHKRYKPNLTVYDKIIK